MKVVIISGPTASGKTEISIALAKKLGGEIVNFDSLLFYKEIKIGSAKPTVQEMDGITHHMLDVRSISHPMNASDYAKESLPLIEALLQKKKLVYLVGGSGFYLQALLKGMYDSPTTTKDISEISDRLYQSDGIAPFLAILKQHDLASFQRYHENDHYRVRRAVEHFWTHGSPLSKEREKKDKENLEIHAPSVHGWDILHLHLDLPREEHLRIIEARTDKMLKLGLIEEVKDLLAKGFSGLEKPLQSIGYKEVLDFNLGVFKTELECRERIIISTRQLAKSQRTWFNKVPGKLTFHPLLQKQEIFNAVQGFIR